MVDILLSTYNGGEYLEDLLSSIFSQTYEKIHLCVHDDGSSDETQSIIRRWQTMLGDQIRVLPSGSHTGDIGQNYFQLLSESDGRYAMFCDQDDIWLPDKVSDSIRYLETAEGYSSGIPTLLHTDLKVVDAGLHVFADSFVRYQRLEPGRCSLPQLIAQNNATGCTMLLNRALTERLRCPPSGELHDRWTALTASAFGRILYYPAQTVLYRQHGRNAVGARNAGTFRYAVKRALDTQGMRQSLRNTYTLAVNFWRTYRDLLSPDQSAFLLEYSQLEQATILERMRVLAKHGAFKRGMWRALAQVLFG